jgi:dihydropteroate synthase
VTASVFDLNPTDSSVLYLRPLCGAVAVARPAARIGGAWAGFDQVEVVVRDGGDTTTGRGSLDDLAAWTAGLGGDHKARIECLLARLTDRRPAFAGICFDEPRIMGVLNVTPDSFSDGGDYATSEAAIARGAEHSRTGAAILDIGGESTRPGSDPVAAVEEARRVVPVIKALAGTGSGAVISIDSRKAEVMAEAVAAGASIINDISALSGDDRALAVAAELGVEVILMHCQGEPKTMQAAPAYIHPPAEIFDYLEGRIKACEAAGIGRDRIAVDPGIGFGKSLEHNLAILSQLSLFQGLGCAVLIGVSRKSFIGHITGEERPKARFPGSVAATVAGLNQGVQMVRAHDVAETRQAVEVWRAIYGGGAEA